LLRDVAHVEGDDHGSADAFQLQDQPQIEAEVGGVYDAYEEIRWRFGRVSAEDHVACDRLVQRSWFQAVGAREIDESEDAAGARAREASFFALDSDAGVISDFLTAAGEAIEEGGLPAVRNADKREAWP
jgi:hypothetical protein